MTRRTLARVPAGDRKEIRVALTGTAAEVRLHRRTDRGGWTRHGLMIPATCLPAVITALIAAHDAAGHAGGTP